MKVYFPNQEGEQNRAEILNILKARVEKLFSGFKTESLLSLSSDGHDQFFLKSPHAILWGKVYFEAFTDNDSELLALELKRLQQVLKQRVHAHVFFREAEFKKGSCGYPSADYFRYQFIQADDEKALLVEKVSPGGVEFELENTLSLFESPSLEKYRFAKSSQLSREELAELIDLNLELKHQA